MSIRDTQDCLLIEVPTGGTSHIRDTQDCLLFEIPYFPVPLTYPLTPPGVMHPQDVTMRMVNLVGETVSPFSGTQQEQLWQGQWWEMEWALAPMLRQNAEQVFAFVAALNGKYGALLAGDHNSYVGRPWPSPQGVATGSPVCAAGNTAGSNQLLTSGWSASIANILAAGDYLQITAVNSLGVSMQRLYKNLFAANSNSSGQATLTIFPPLREAPGSGTSIVLTDTAGTFRLSDNSPEVRIARNGLYTITLKMKEVL